MNDMESVVRAAAASRMDGTPIPDPARWPEGWVHLSAAVAAVAEALLNEGSGLEAAYSFVHALESPGPTENPGFAKYRSKLATQIAEQFTELCRCEFLVTGHRRIGGAGPVEPIPSEWWDTEDIFLRFRTWSIDPDDELSSRPDLPHWIWVEEIGLKRMCDKIWRYNNNVNKVTFVDEETLLSVSDALEVLAPFVPHISGPPMRLGAPDGAKELRDACASGAVRAIATRMERSFDAAGLGGNGKLVEAENDWPIPAELWTSIELSPAQNWAAGTFVAIPNERNRVKLSGVMIDWRDLTSYLEGQKLLLRIQLREPDEEEPFAEAFMPAVPVEFPDPINPDGEIIRISSGPEEPEAKGDCEAPSKADEAKCKELAARLDSEGVAIRDVKAPLIARLWDTTDGPVPKKETITGLMTGQRKGRRPTAS
ncbi:hypothetical protein [Pelagerythrobacter aerophilus]|nr:hypothetical protein [Pelagerythrobacter aerophilus]